MIVDLDNYGSVLTVNDLESVVEDVIKFGHAGGFSEEEILENIFEAYGRLEEGEISTKHFEGLEKHLLGIRSFANKNVATLYASLIEPDRMPKLMSEIENNEAINTDPMFLERIREKRQV